MTPGKESMRVRVWDLPTRLFHWLLALTVSGALLSAELGGNAMDWHVRLGLFALTLLLFRLVWGVIGPRWARFASFVKGPAAVLRYVRGDPAEASRAAGHSPLGALSVLAMLVVLLVQVATGLVADDEIITAGPLARHVGAMWTTTGTWWHAGVGPYLVYGLIALHLAAIAYYALVRRKPLVAAMVHGDKPLLEPLPPASDGPRIWLLAAVVWLACAAVAWWLWRLGA